MITTLILLGAADVAGVNTTIILVCGQIIVATISGFCLIKVSQLKSHVNSRMDQLLKLTSEAGFAKGKTEGESVVKKIKKST